mmetsp:Transcript_100548/g.267270  ORF Transcript_100548/g.267270 Transcript_100548/m.267270 type:complete len:509 (+) Transcript_100548:898-2424(+)
MRLHETVDDFETFADRVHCLLCLFGFNARACVAVARLPALGHPGGHEQLQLRRSYQHLCPAAEHLRAQGGLLEPLGLRHENLDGLAALVVVALHQQLPRRLRGRQLEGLGARHRGRRLAVAAMHDLGGGVHVLHDKDHVLEAKLYGDLLAQHHVLLVKHDVHKLLVRADAGQRDVHDGPVRVLRHALDEARLARARGPVQQQAELVWVAGDLVFARLAPEVLQDLQKRLLLVKEKAPEGLLAAQLVALVGPPAPLVPLAALAARANLHLVQVPRVVLHLLELPQVPLVRLVDKAVDGVGAETPEPVLERADRLLGLLALVLLALFHAQLHHRGIANGHHRAAALAVLGGGVSSDNLQRLPPVDPDGLPDVVGGLQQQLVLLQLPGRRLLVVVVVPVPTRALGLRHRGEHDPSPLQVRVLLVQEQLHCLDQDVIARVPVHGVRVAPHVQHGLVVDHTLAHRPLPEHAQVQLPIFDHLGDKVDAVKDELEDDRDAHGEDHVQDHVPRPQR